MTPIKTGEYDDVLFIDTKRMSPAPIIGAKTLWLELSKNKNLCDEIAEQLEIHADGGDDAGAYVQKVAIELVKEARCKV